MGFPWYDSDWLNSYEAFKRGLGQTEKSEFEKALSVFKTSKDFKVIVLKSFLKPDLLLEMKRRISEIQMKTYEFHEFESFGRYVVHNDDFFNQLQERFKTEVTKQVGEELDTSYNFLSLYKSAGQCPPHMDAPLAKWTLDICIDQSQPWPIYFSDIQDWPQSSLSYKVPGWEKRLQTQLDFKEYRLEPGDAIIFSGSSQWHMRQKLKTADSNFFCHLIFFHYIPKGSQELLDPDQWRVTLGDDKAL